MSIVVGVTLPVLILLGGGAVDYAKRNDAQVKLQSIADAALLATLSYKKQHPNASLRTLQSHFEREFAWRFKNRLKNKGVQLKKAQLVKVDKDTYRAVTSAEVKTHFLALASYKTMDIAAVAEAKTSHSRTEVALVLDTTGSMSGRKLRELKEAAKNFIEVIDRKFGNDDPDAFKVAIVPFAQYVNVGLNHRHDPWIRVPRNTKAVGYFWRWIGWRWIYERRSVAIRWEGCVGSRNYPLNVKDENYGFRVPGVMNYARRKYGGYEINWYGRNSCPSPLMPLKSVRTYKHVLKRTIDSFRAWGSTYIPAGLIWGWRVLSPQAPFTEGADADEVKRLNVRKVIVLMTDGANTRAPARNSSRYYYQDHISSDSRYANRLTKEVCANITAVNPATGRRNADIITITFNIRNRTIKQLMEQCATLGSYDVKSGGLVRAFENIAGQLAELHLSR